MLNKSLLFAAAVAAGVVSAEACTSWIIHPSVTKSGRMIVQKCRDSRVGPLSAEILTAPNGWRWMRIGTGGGWATFAMNEKGVVATMNDGNNLTVKHPGKGRLAIGTGHMLRQVMRQCDNAYQGAMLIREHCRNTMRVGRGGTFFVADAERAFMVDVAPGYGEVKELTGGMIIISNCLHLPGIEEISRQSVGTLRSDRSREANVRAALQKFRENGKYTVKGSIRTSRLKCGRTPQEKHPFRKNSLGGVCFEIDKEFPAYLSTAYIALGPQQHTFYLPTPMAVRQLPEPIRNGKWADIAYAFRKKAGDDHAEVKALFEFEERIFPEYEAVREEARKLLKSGKKAEAVDLLNKCYERQFKEAEKLLPQLVERVAENPDSYSKSYF